jgi:hypothetical protein
MIAYASSRRLGTCRSCGARVEWLTNVKTDKAHPFDSVVIETALGDLDPQVVRVDMARSVSHFATCPQAEAWRKRREHA